MKNLPVDFEFSQHATEPGRLSSQFIYFRLSLKTVIFTIVKSIQIRTVLSLQACIINGLNSNIKFRS